MIVLGFSVQGVDVIEHTNAKCHLCALLANLLTIM